jgi:hypothetical protein
MWENIREDVKQLPPKEICGRPSYIVTGTSRTSRNGIMDENRVETLVYPGERWHKCCIITDPSKPNAKPRFVCEHLKTIDHPKLHRELKGWCGPHKCTDPKQRCLVVDNVEDKGYKAKKRGECPLMCGRQCDKLTQKFECINTGKEPPYGHEGLETPKGRFGESEPYDVFALTTSVNSADAADLDQGDLPPVERRGVSKESSVPLVAAFLVVPPLERRGVARHECWSNFLS